MKSFNKKLRGTKVTVLETPFDGLSDVERDELRTLMSAASSNDVEFALSELSKIFEGCNKIHLLSQLAFYGLLRAVTKSGELSERENALQQVHIEFAQAIALTIPIAKLASEVVSPDALYAAWGNLLKAHKAFDLTRIDQISTKNNATEKAILILQEQMRMHTHFVRNWGNFLQVIDISKRMYSALDEDCVSANGFSISELIDIMASVVTLVSERMNTHRKKVMYFLGADTTARLVDRYITSFPDVGETKDEMDRNLRKRGLTREEVRSLLISHSDLRLSDIFSYRVEDIADVSGVEASKIEAACRRLSLPAGSLVDQKIEHFFLDNPVWLRPFIPLIDGKYYCAAPHAFFSFINPIITELLSNKRAAHKRLSERRSQFLEMEVERLFRANFEGAIVHRNLKWSEGHVEYETDILIKIDSFVIIVEAKSGSISQPTRRGATLSLKRDIEELLISPGIQSTRLMNKLMRMKEGGEIDPTFLSMLGFELSEVNEIIRLSVTLEEFASIQTHLMGVVETGWIPAEYIAAPTTTLADLEVIFHILDNVPQRLHYFLRRAEMEATMKYHGGELDLLGYYLESGLKFGAEEHDAGRFIFVGHSKSIDDYYQAEELGIETVKPAPRYQSWFKRIENRIVQTAFSRWTEAAVTLLSVSFRDQIAIERAFKQLTRRVNKHWREDGHHNQLIVRPPLGQDQAIAFIAYKEEEKGRRDEYAQSALSEITKNREIRRCVVIGVNIDRSEYPYGFLSIADL